jgi:hypothetical protein
MAKTIVKISRNNSSNNYVAVLEGVRNNNFATV